MDKPRLHVGLCAERDKSQHPHRPAQSSSVNHWHDGIRSGEESLFYVEYVFFFFFVVRLECSCFIIEHINVYALLVFPDKW